MAQRRTPSGASVKWLKELLRLDPPQTPTSKRVDEMSRRTDVAVAKAEQLARELDKRRRYIEAERRSYGGRP